MVLMDDPFGLVEVRMGILSGGGAFNRFGGKN